MGTTDTAGGHASQPLEERQICRSSCYQEHEAIKRDPARWAALPFVAVWDLSHDGGSKLELRNCPRCKSTLAVELVAAADLPEAA